MYIKYCYQLKNTYRCISYKHRHWSITVWLFLHDGTSDK